MNFKNVIDPITNQLIDINSVDAKKIIYNYILHLQSGGMLQMKRKAPYDITNLSHRNMRARLSDRIKRKIAFPQPNVEDIKRMRFEIEAKHYLMNILKKDYSKLDISELKRGSATDEGEDREKLFDEIDNYEFECNKIDYFFSNDIYCLYRLRFLLKEYISFINFKTENIESIGAKFIELIFGYSILYEFFLIFERIKTEKGREKQGMKFDMPNFEKIIGFFINVNLLKQLELDKLKQIFNIVYIKKTYYFDINEGNEQVQEEEAAEEESKIFQILNDYVSEKSKELELKLFQQGFSQQVPGEIYESTKEIYKVSKQWGRWVKGSNFLTGGNFTSGEGNGLMNKLNIGNDEFGYQNHNNDKYRIVDSLGTFLEPWHDFAKSTNRKQSLDIYRSKNKLKKGTKIDFLSKDEDKRLKIDGSLFGKMWPEPIFLKNLTKWNAYVKGKFMNFTIVDPENPKIKGKTRYDEWINSQDDVNFELIIESTDDEDEDEELTDQTYMIKYFGIFNFCVDCISRFGQVGLLGKTVDYGIPELIESNKRTIGASLADPSSQSYEDYTTTIDRMRELLSEPYGTAENKLEKIQIDHLLEILKNPGQNARGTQIEEIKITNKFLGIDLSQYYEYSINFDNDKLFLKLNDTGQDPPQSLDNVIPLELENKSAYSILELRCAIEFLLFFEKALESTEADEIIIDLLKKGHRLNEKSVFAKSTIGNKPKLGSSLKRPLVWNPVQRIKKSKERTIFQKQKRCLELIKYIIETQFLQPQQTVVFTTEPIDAHVENCYKSISYKFENINQNRQNFLDKISRLKLILLDMKKFGDWNQSTAISEYNKKLLEYIKAGGGNEEEKILKARNSLMGMVTIDALSASKAILTDNVFVLYSLGREVTSDILKSIPQILKNKLFGLVPNPTRVAGCFYTPKLFLDFIENVTRERRAATMPLPNDDD